jgi:hypothetical protein
MTCRDTVRALVGAGDPTLWDTLLERDQVSSPLRERDGSRYTNWGRVMGDSDTVVPALLAQDKPRLNDRLVRESFCGDFLRYALDRWRLRDPYQTQTAEREAF